MIPGQLGFFGAPTLADVPTCPAKKSALMLQWEQACIDQVFAGADRGHIQFFGLRLYLPRPQRAGNNGSDFIRSDVRSRGTSKIASDGAPTLPVEGSPSGILSMCRASQASSSASVPAHEMSRMWIAVPPCQ